jgi:anti-anti-sigma factor
MPLEQWSEEIVLARLSDDPQFSEDLSLLHKQLRNHPRGAVLDFSGVRFLNSSNLGALLELRKLAGENGAQLVLCAVPTTVWGAFLVTGLDKIFRFVDDMPSALASLQIQQA